MKSFIYLLALTLLPTAYAGAEGQVKYLKTLITCQQPVKTQWEEVGIVFNEQTRRPHAIIMYHDGVNAPRPMGNRPVTRTEKNGVVTYADDFNTTRLVFNKQNHPLTADLFRPNRSHKKAWPCYLSSEIPFPVQTIYPTY